MSQKDGRAQRQLTLSRALREFFDYERAGSVLMLLAVATAVLWANSPWKDGYETLWSTQVTIAVGRHRLDLDLREWVNDGLMTIFFLVVALEIKRARVEGELREWRAAALPIVAAVGGMVLPAAIYLAVNADGATHGWGIPIATDIALALGVAAIARPDLPASLRVFLLTLAIADDIGAIAVIVVFYSSSVSWTWLVVAAVIVGFVVVLRRWVSYGTLVVLAGAPLWLTLEVAGIEPTVAGIVLGLLAPASPVLTREVVDRRRDELLDVFTVRSARATAAIARQAVSELEWIEHVLHPWSSLLVVPVFALANAGVGLSPSDLSAAFHSRVTWGIVLGLVVGKAVGISVATWLGTRSGLPLPDGSSWRDLVGVATVGGLGFTVALFITGLAFSDRAIVQNAQIGVFAGSLLAGTAGAVVLTLAKRRAPSRA
jgi:NhaA family Na+:H+ antiporter